MTMRKFIKLMFLRHGRSNAKQMAAHLAGELLNHGDSMNTSELLKLIDDVETWLNEADRLDDEIKQLTAQPCPIDESETLSPRCTSPLFWVK